MAFVLIREAAQIERRYLSLEQRSGHCRAGPENQDFRRVSSDQWKPCVTIAIQGV
ncbi:hypothetical protein BN844_5213 [Pseudomonas sp. SHC52]|nr:hypothetical protein BN844_5213 [Pseudomonas sp. SHC52]